MKKFKISIILMFLILLITNSCYCTEFNNNVVNDKELSNINFIYENTVVSSTNDEYITEVKENDNEENTEDSNITIQQLNENIKVLQIIVVMTFLYIFLSNMFRLN